MRCGLKSMARQVFIYVLLDADNQCRYVGKSVNVQRRFKDHRRRKFAWAVMYDVLETCDEAGWEEREKHWIAYGRAQGWPLENIAKGGNGWPAGSRHSDQTRAKIGDIVRLRLTDPKARAKLAGAWRGQKHSQEARAKIAKSVRQRFTD